MKASRFSFKYNRTNFLKEGTSFVNGKTVSDYDLSTSYFYMFRATKGYRSYQVERTEVNRPDILSYKIYNTMDYWWIILKFNDIVDPFTEIREGLILKIPYLSDIQDYYKVAMEEKEKSSNR